MKKEKRSWEEGLKIVEGHFGEKHILDGEECILEEDMSSYYWLNPKTEEVLWCGINWENEEGIHLQLNNKEGELIDSDLIKINPKSFEEFIKICEDWLKRIRKYNFKG